MAREALTTEGLVLRLRPLGESDVVVQLMTKSCGRVAAVAKHARQSKRRFVGMQSGASGLCRLVPTRTELWRLESFEPSDTRTALATDVLTSGHAAYILELLERLTALHHAEDGELGSLAVVVLDQLKDAAPTAERLRIYELHLLATLGLLPDFSRCASCGDGLAQEGARLRDEAGDLACHACAGDGPTVDKAVLDALTALLAVPIADASRVTLPGPIRGPARRLLHGLIRHHASGPLRSLAFLSQLARDAISEPTHPARPPEDKARNPPA